MMKQLGMILIALLGALTISAQATDQSPFVGTWKLNVAKSKFNPGPPMKSQTVTIGQDGKISIEGVASDGTTTENWSYMYSDNQETPITGMDNSSVVEKRNGNVVEHKWKLNGAQYTGKGVISKNGKVMTYTMDGTDAQGRHEHNVMVYDKQ
jgi:hypothetical protein